MSLFSARASGVLDPLLRFCSQDLNARDRQAERGVSIDCRQCWYLKKIHDACTTPQAHESEMLDREEKDANCTTLLW